MRLGAALERGLGGRHLELLAGEEHGVHRGVGVDALDIVPPGAEGTTVPLKFRVMHEEKQRWRKRQGARAHGLRGRRRAQDRPLLAFLILLPFYASLPAMLARRLVHGLWFDTIGLIIFSALFTGLMVLLGVQLYLSLRSRVELGDTAVQDHAAAGAAGATPMLHFVNTRDPLRQDRRRRDARSAVRQGQAPVLLRATRLGSRTASTCGSATSTRTTSTRRCPSRRSAPRSPSAPASRSWMPGRCAARSRSRCSSSSAARRPEASPPLTDVEKAEINSRHVRAMKYLVAGMAALVVAGIAIDVFTAPRTSYALGGAATTGGKR